MKTIEEARAAKSSLEIKILQMVRLWEREFSLSATDVHLVRVHSAGDGPGGGLVSVEIEVKLR